MDAERQAKWERIDAHLRTAIADVDLGITHHAQLEEFLDHNELGVAFEWIVSVISERQLAISEAVRQHLAAAATEMHLEGNSDWQHLHAGG